ncbi:MAG: UvrD-helicase domain-containing protein [archaeon]
MEEDLEYIKILKALMELPFQVGKNLLVDFLNGNYKNVSIIKNRLDELDGFESLLWSKDKLIREIDKLIANGMIDFVASDYNKFIKVLSLTIKGQNEIARPTLPGKKLANRVEFKKTEISDEDRVRFKALDSFLGWFNDEQKKAIISGSSNVLCVAGAGSGKTTVLTKRIEFLVKYKGVDASKILAVTFTRKARREMQRRLDELGIVGVVVHTFNSFCEGILRRHGAKIYGRTIRMQGYGDKILAINMALASVGLDIEDVVSDYFTSAQRKFKTKNQMANSFMHDCFSVIDYFKVTGTDEYDFSKDVDVKNKDNAKRIYQITRYLKEHMETQGLRDYTDQVVDAIKFLKGNPSDVPKFEHVLVDEYQDVNAMQIELIGLLASPSLFAVGDPRQSIFGWRGSDVNYIVDFEKSHKNVEVIHLMKNYRSAREIVEFMNHSIRNMGLPDLEHHKVDMGAARGIPSKLGTSEEVPSSSVAHNSVPSEMGTGVPSSSGKVRILDFENEEAEREFVIENIVNCDMSDKEIFVLARTNRQLMELSQLMKVRGIGHAVRSDDQVNGGRLKVEGEQKVGNITLATVHAIKGLEAKKVFVIGANEQNFPCKASDHPAIEMVKTDSYNKEEEERRLFYVAISRAKEILYVTYSGKKPTYFINDEMKKLG